MLVRHLLCGLFIGVLATLSAALGGFSVLGILGSFLLGTQVGLGASVLGALSSRPVDADELHSVLR